MDQLAESFRQSKHGAFEAVVAAHVDSVYRFMRSLSGANEDAEDLTQETFLEAERSARHFRGECSLRTWLHRIAYRRFCRWKDKRRPTVSPEGFEFAVEHEASNFRIDLDRALAELSQDQRAVFLLAEVEQFDLSEVAASLELPLGTVKSRLSRAKAALRLALTEDEDPAWRNVDELSNR